MRTRVDFGLLASVDRTRLVALNLDQTGFATVETRPPIPDGSPGDPLTALIGRNAP